MKLGGACLFSPYASAGEEDWMPVDTDHVQTGWWAGEQPAPQNLCIISYLRNRQNPDPRVGGRAMQAYWDAP